jgi:starch synthase
MTKFDRPAVLFLAAEAIPYMKVGGLADVAGSLPRMLMRHSDPPEVRLFLPLHGGVMLGEGAAKPVDSLVFEGQLRPWQAHLHVEETVVPPVYFIGGDGIEQESPVYSAYPAADGLKFALFSLAALEFCRRMGWQPDLVHANDWHTALAVHALRTLHRDDPYWARTASLLTIHNLPYQGQDAEPALTEFQMQASDDARVPEWGLGVPLALGISAADKVNTVSPGYAAEAQTPEHGAGLEKLLAARSADFSGILNGIDVESWNPAEDKDIISRFDVTHPGARRPNKLSLQAELGLGPNSAIPLLAIVGRLDEQKGIDIALEALTQCLDQAWRLVVLGTGDPRLESAVREFFRRHPDRGRAHLRYDASLARRIYAGADMLLIPSRYEPCGLTQMLGMRYGCLPVARAVGGLKDTIRDADDSPNGTGFLVAGSSPVDFAEGIRRGLRTFARPMRWGRLQRNAMREDFSWAPSVEKYVDLYREALAARRPPAQFGQEKG